MTDPVDYAHLEPRSFGGITPPASIDDARVVLLPIPLDRTTSYVPGTRYAPREILAASTQTELWDEELQLDISRAGILTLPEMELPFADQSNAIAEIERVARAIGRRDVFLITLGGEHSVTPPLVKAAATRHPGLSVLQVDAHADLRESYLGSPHSHACAMRRTLEVARCTQVGIRSISEAEARDVPGLATTIFYDTTMRRDPVWIDRVVETLADRVYLTIDCDGLDSGIMPAVGTPEPGGLSWHELLALVRRVFERRQVVGCDVVELCPIPGMVAPNLLVARLVYKLIGYHATSTGLLSPAPPG
jgi:agmatinase